MAARALDIRIMRKGRKMQDIHVTADPDDTPALQSSLKNWLDGGKWDRRLWNQFSAEVRYANQGRLLKIVRTS